MNEKHAIESLQNFEFRSVTLVVSKTDSLMIDELVELKSKDISQELFNEILDSHKKDFYKRFNTTVKKELPNHCQKIGNGCYSI